MDFSTGDESEVPEIAGPCDTEHLFDKMTASGASLPERGPAISRVETDASVDSMDKPKPVPLLDWAERNNKKVVEITKDPRARTRAVLHKLIESSDESLRRLAEMQKRLREIEGLPEATQPQSPTPEPGPPVLLLLQGGRAGLGRPA
jgi:hypothetical protein